MTARTLAQALTEIASALREFARVRALDPRELASYKLNLVAGWEIPALIDSSDLTLRVLVPANAPYARIRIAVWPAPPPLAWPHLEDHGLLCLLPDEATHATGTPGELTLELLRSGKVLVEDCLRGVNFDDFEDEFLSYWARWPKRTATIVSLCRHDGDSRLVHAWTATNAIYVADSKDELEAWLHRRFDRHGRTDIRTVPLLRLARAPRPVDYPSTVADLLRLVDAERITEHLLDASAREKTIVAAATTRRGEALFGFRIIPPVQGSRRGQRGLTTGFRNAPPKEVLLARYSGLSVIGADVIRVDGSWIHGRDQNPDQPRLAHARVILLGVGSLGSGVATTLAQAGIGDLSLVDPQVLQPENASRHVLGLEALRLNKAQGAAALLQRRLPHLNIQGYNLSAEEFAAKHPEKLIEADLVIAATANWSADTWLNAWAMEHRAGRPLLFAWMEPHAAAGHAVVTWGQGACVRCLFNELGGMRYPATSWRDRTTQDIPACGGTFQPYGAVELSSCQELTSRAALDVLLKRLHDATHDVWLSREAYLQAVGGQWNAAWTEQHGPQAAGGIVRRFGLTPSEQCREHASR